MADSDNKFQRQVAYKVLISDIVNSSISDGQISLNGNNVARVNVIAYSVYKPEGDSMSMVIDDGTGKINLRAFESTVMFSSIDIGDIVLVVGRIREFNNERYIMPEIVKKISNPEWINLRKIELGKNKIISVEDVPEAEVKAELNPKEDVYTIIRNLDTGDGVSFEDVISKSKNPDAEKMINSLLQNGDVFEIRPGRLKVLE
ncbi:MAG: OB-fold nucleic acid binding domain-containing protein [Nanoarchaeota archaeon]